MAQIEEIVPSTFLVKTETETREMMKTKNIVLKILFFYLKL